ncbi:hypothetical protein CR513_57220, partial [Mucuna pruriens]
MGTKLKCLRIDNDMEFVLEQFNKFCRKLAFAHVKQDKVGARAIKCVFIGYPPRIKGYKLWRMEHSEPKCIISRDIVFDETRMAMMSQDQQVNNQESDSDNTQVEVELLVH